MNTLLHLVSVLRHPLAYHAHQRSVRVQNEHLDGRVHRTADPGCDYCIARSADLGQRALAGDIAADDSRLIKADQPGWCQPGSAAPRGCPDREACSTGTPCAVALRWSDD